jgi:hypothetical protein
VKPLAGGFKVIDSNGSEAVQGRCIVTDLEGCGALNLCLRWRFSHSMRMEETCRHRCNLPMALGIALVALGVLSIASYAVVRVIELASRH